MPYADDTRTEDKLIQGWECIGCGRIEVLQDCIGVCQDQRVELVYAADYQELQAQVANLRKETARMEAIVRQLALSKPHEGQWKRSFMALQQRARQTLAQSEHPDTAPLASG